jgi:hypothetical protein
MARIDTLRRRATGSATVLAAAVLVVTLAGCVQDAPVSSAPPSTTSAAASTPTPTSTAVPVLVAGGTAAQNKPFFDYVNQQSVTAAGGAPDGPAFITALRNNGFPGDAMQVTADITTVGVHADSIQFSVKMPDACLIGQWGTANGYSSITAPVLATGACLVGQTRTIDF